MLPIADPDRLGEHQPLRSKRLFRQLDAVERGIVRAKLVVERHLLLEFRAAVVDHAGDPMPVLGLEPLDAHGPDAVEHPDLERLALDPGRRAIVDHGGAVLDGNDPRVREGAPGGPGDEPTQGEGAAQGPGIAEPEDDVSLPKHVLAPTAPAGHRRVRGQWWKLSRQPGTGRGRTPEVSRPGRRFHPVGRFRRSLLGVPERDHQAVEPDHGEAPGARPRIGPTPGPLMRVITVPESTGHAGFDVSPSHRVAAATAGSDSCPLAPGMADNQGETRTDMGNAPRDAPGVDDDVPPDEQPARARDAGNGRHAGRSTGSLADRPWGLVTRHAGSVDVRDAGPGH